VLLVRALLLLMNLKSNGSVSGNFNAVNDCSSVVRSCSTLVVNLAVDDSENVQCASQVVNTSVYGPTELNGSVCMDSNVADYGSVQFQKAARQDDCLTNQHPRKPDRFIGDLQIVLVLSIQYLHA